VTANLFINISAASLFVYFPMDGEKRVYFPVDEEKAVSFPVEEVKEVCSPMDEKIYFPFPINGGGEEIAVSPRSRDDMTVFEIRGFTSCVYNGRLLRKFSLICELGFAKIWRLKTKN